MSIKKLIFALSILFVMGSCGKDDADKDPSEYTKDDFISAYTFNYTTTERAQSEGESDQITTGTRTIFIEDIDYCDNGTDLSIKNLFGFGDSYCFSYSGNSYIMTENSTNGEGKLVGAELSIDATRYFRNVKGTATKN